MSSTHEFERKAQVRLETLARVSDALAQARLDLPSLLKVIADETASALGDSCGISLLSEDGEHLYMSAYRLLDPEAHALYTEIIAHERFPKNTGLTGMILKKAEGTLLVPKVDPDQLFQRISPKYRPFFERFPLHSLIGTCLRAEGRLLGIISAARYAPGPPYEEEDAQMLEAIAQRASWAIANARQHAELQAERQRLSRLQEVTAALAVAKTPEEVAAVAITHALAALDAPRGGLWVLGEDGASLVLAGARGYSDENIQRFARIPLGAPLRIPVVEAFQRGEALFIESETEFTRLYPELRASTPQIMSLFATACLPLVVDQRSAGVLNFVFDKPRVFSSEERAFLGIIARLCAQTFERTRLYQAEVLSRRRLEEVAAERESALRELEVERQRLAAVLHEAQAAARAKDEFLAMLGHELRNPLAPILTVLQLLQLRAGDAFQKEHTVIERQVWHMVRLVDDLLDVSRITRGKIELKKRPLELMAVIAKAVEMVSPLVEEREHRLSISVPSGLFVDADEHRLAQIFSNLLTNAAKYTEPGGIIEVSVEPHEQGASLSVRDTGIGIGPELLPRVFDLFVQGERTLDRAKGGLGLGLAIVKNLVELHGGRVGVTSEGPGRGSTFTVWLPLSGRGVQEAPEPSAAARSPGAPRSSSEKRILLVDDNRDAVEALAEGLEAFGYLVMVAFDGPEGLEAATRQRPDLALLDIGLPVMDGYELARRLRGLPGMGTVPLIALTGYGQETDRRRALEAGFHDHIVKPVDLTRLKSLLREVLSPSSPGASS